MSDHAKVVIGGEELGFRLSWRAMRNLSEKYKKPFQEVLARIGTGELVDVMEDVLFYGLEAAKNPKDRDWLEEHMDFAELDGYIEAIRAACPKSTQQAIESASGNA